MIPSFTEEELRCLRFLAERYDSGDRRSWFVRPSELPGYETLGDAKIREFITRFKKYNLVQSNSIDTYRPTDKVHEILASIDNPQPPNEWNDLVAWWFKSKWRTGIAVVTVLLPLIVQWISMIRTVLEWIGVVPPSASR